MVLASAEGAWNLSAGALDFEEFEARAYFLGCTAHTARRNFRTSSILHSSAFAERKFRPLERKLV